MIKILNLKDMVRVLKMYRDYCVECRGNPANIFGENYDTILETALKEGRRATLQSGVNSIVQSARSIADTPEADKFFSYAREKLGIDLFDLTSTPSVEAKAIISRGKISGHEEARTLAAYLELYDEDPGEAEELAVARSLLDNFEDNAPKET